MIIDRPNYGSDNPNQSWLNLTRDGVVYDRRQGANGPEVQVYYSDRDILSDWLPVRLPGSAGTVHHYCPRIGDAVTVENQGTGIEQGVVTGSRPTTNNPGIIPNSLDSTAMSTDDGAYFEHEPNSGTTTIAGVGTLHISVNGETLAFSGPWTLNASGNVQITSPQINLNGVLIDSSGNVTIPGNLTVKGTTNMKQAIANPNCQNTDGSGGGT